jgi:hypothetical protein
MINLLYSVVAILAATGTLVDPPEIEWTKTYFEEQMNWFLDIHESEYGGYVGAAWLLGTDNDCVVRLDADGNVQWTGGAFWYSQGANWVEELGDGGFIAAGLAKADPDSTWGFLLTRLDPDGEVIWSKLYDRPNSLDEAFCVTPLPDGGFAACGELAPSSGNSNAWIMRTDENGDTLWTQMFDRDYGMAGRRVVHVDNGLTAYLWGSPNDGGNVRLIRFSMAGDILWEADEFPDNFASFSVGGDMCYSPADGGYTLTTHYNPRIAHTDSLGNLEWTSGVPAISQPFGWSINRTMEGGYIFGGQNTPDPDQPWTEYFGVISRYYPCGTLMWWDHIYDGDCKCIYSIRQLSEGGYIAAGQTLDNKGLLIKYAPETGVEEGSGVPGGAVLGTVHPNPSAGRFQIPVLLTESLEARIEVYDITGRRVALLWEGLLPAGEHGFEWEASGMPDGCYLVRLSTPEASETTRCVLLE